uniref:Uncharacterized protein n=1 Tax=Rhizophora mucronata TaxID=61149 RepID=A0A2P2QKZ5_RHIMU
MANTKLVENERDPLELLVNLSGEGKKARPICCLEVFVSSNRPLGWIFAIPLRRSLAPTKPS